MLRASRRSARTQTPRARGSALGAVLGALGITVVERYRTPPVLPVEGREPLEAPQMLRADEPAEGVRGSGRRRLLLVTLPVLVVLAAAIALAGLAYSALGTITTVAGTGGGGSTGDGGQATAATLTAPRGIAVGPDGDLYIAENNRIRRVSKATGVISHFAGTGLSTGSLGDGGPATEATINGPYGVAVASDGTVSIAETNGHRVRTVAPGGTITTLAGTGSAGYSGDGGPATSAALRGPHGVAVASDGSVLIADTANNVVRKVDTSGTISTVAGTGVPGYSGTGGQATSALMTTPAAVLPTGDGGFYVAEQGNHRVRRVDAAGVISLVAGNGTAAFAGDGGAATSASLNGPSGLGVGVGGTLYISDTNNNRVRSVSTGGTMSTTAGDGGTTSDGDGGTASLAGVVAPRHLSLTSAGMYIAESGGNKIRFVEGYGLAAPTVTATSPVGPANNNVPKVIGTAPAGSTVKLYTDATCTSAVVGSGTAAEFAGAGITASVADDSTTTLRARAFDAFNVASACSSTSVSYTEDSTPPATPTITGGPAGPSSDATPTWTFTTSGGTIQCRVLEGATQLVAWGACSSP